MCHLLANRREQPVSATPSSRHKTCIISKKFKTLAVSHCYQQPSCHQYQQYYWHHCYQVGMATAAELDSTSSSVTLQSQHKASCHPANCTLSSVCSNKYTHTCLTALCPGLTGSDSTRKVKPIWILLKQEVVSGSGISRAICKSAPRSRQITMPAPNHSVFTGRMPFLPPNQQCQSTEGSNKYMHAYVCAHFHDSK